MQKKRFKSKINSPHQYGFATKIKSWTETINDNEEFILEFVLEIPNRRGKNFQKLVYASGEIAKKYRENLENRICVFLSGKHEKCPYKTKRPQFLTDLGIFKIKSLSIDLKYNGEPKFSKDYYEAIKEKNGQIKVDHKHIPKRLASHDLEIPSWIELIPRQTPKK